MARQNAGFVDQHIEKVALGVCACVLVGAVWYSFVGNRFAVEDLDPEALCRQVGEEANRTAQAIRSARPELDDPSTAVTEADPVAEWFGSEKLGLSRIAQLETPFPRTQPFPPPFMPVTVTPEEERRGLATLVRPGIPIVTTGRTGFDLPAKKPELADYTGQPPRDTLPTSVRNWVSVAAQVDLIEQDIFFGTANYPEGSYLTIVAVHLQRLDESEPWRGWQDVAVYTPYKPSARPDLVDRRTGEIRLSGIQEFRSLLESKQEYIARPELPERVSGDRVVPPAVPYFPDPPTPDDKPETLAKRWRGMAERALRGRKPVDGPDLDAALILARAAAAAGASPKELQKAREILDAVVKQLRAKGRRGAFLDSPLRPADRLMPIVAHDLDVVPGRTYAYRIRYEALNIYAGLTGELKDPADARKLTVFSNWSPVSRRVVPKSDLYFYLTKANRSKEEVTVTVFRRKGISGFEKARFKVRVGDEIGGEKRLGRPKGDFRTGAICVALDFAREVEGKQTVAMVYVDQNDGSLRERLLSRDLNDPFHKQLSNRKTARR